MYFQPFLSVLAGALEIIGFLPYIRAILKGETKPMKASWIIWATLDAITLAGMYAENTVNGQILAAVIGASTVTVLAMRYGTPGWTTLEKYCLVGAVLGIGLWQVFGSPVLGIVTSLSLISLGSIPTFLSAWHDPSKEDRTGWTFFWLSSIAAVSAIPSWTLADAAQPITFLSLISIMMYLLFLRPRKKVTII